MDSHNFTVVLKQKSGLMTIFEYFDEKKQQKLSNNIYWTSKKHTLT